MTLVKTDSARAESRSQVLMSTHVPENEGPSSVSRLPRTRIVNAREGADGEGEARNSELQGGADMRGQHWREEAPFAIGAE